jgi:hypothetical protein
VSVTTNPYEAAGRLTKAFKLASRIHRDGFSAEEATAESDEWWAWMAGRAKTKVPSAETRLIAVRMVRDMERGDEGNL